jgi:hypothetical protein
MDPETMERAAALCERLFPLVPWPNDWQGSEREQLIFGKGMVAGAQACAAMLREVLGRGA